MNSQAWLVELNKVKKFNELAGNLVNVTAEKLVAQQKVIDEELSELNKAIVAKDKVEILDGWCDVVVTVYGKCLMLNDHKDINEMFRLIRLYQEIVDLEMKLSTQGYKTFEAFQRVCDNNLLKFPLVSEKDKYQYDEGITLTVSEVDSERLVPKDANGKVRKFKDFPKVDLTDLIPQY